MALHQTKKLLCGEGNYQQSKKVHTLEGRYLQMIYPKGVNIKTCKEFVQLNTETNKQAS